MKKAVDMTKGSPFKTILLFAIPIALGFTLQQMYTMGDSLIVSLSLGATATTGVNLTGSLNFMVLGFAQGITAGMGIVLSQFVGAKNEDKMRRSVATAMSLCAMVAIILSVLATILARPILTLLETSEEYIDYAVSYISTIFIGMIFTVFYNLTDQILRAMGDSKTPLIILILCAILNIGLNSLLFIFPHWGVAWAGWATVISQGISAVVGFAVIFKRFPQLRIKKSDFRFTGAFAWHHLRVGLPMAFQFMITALSCMIQQRAFNLLGPIDEAYPEFTYAMAQSTAIKIDNIFGCLINGCGVAMATYVGQNYGARDMQRIKKGYFSAMGVCGIFTAVSMAGALLSCYPFSRILLPNVDERIYDLAFKYILTNSSLYYVLSLVFMSRQAVQAMGQSVLSVVGGVIELGMRTAVSFTFAVWFGFDGAVWSNPLAWVGAAAFLVCAFFYHINKLIKKENARVEEKDPELESQENEPSSDATCA